MNKKLYDQIVKERPYLWWWVKNKEKLSRFLTGMFENILTHKQLVLAERLLPEMKDFYLAGGTGTLVERFLINMSFRPKGEILITH